MSCAGRAELEPSAFLFSVTILAPGRADRERLSRLIAKPRRLVTDLAQGMLHWVAEERGETAMLQRSLIGLALAGAIASSAAAQDLPKNQFKGIGLNSPTPVARS